MAVHYESDVCHQQKFPGGRRQDKMNGMATKPEEEYKFGAVRAAIWSNLRKTNNGNSFYSQKAVLERIYKDKDGQFKTTNSFDLNDIPKAILALTKSYEFLLTAGAKNKTNGDMPFHHDKIPGHY